MNVLEELKKNDIEVSRSETKKYVEYKSSVLGRCWKYEVNDNTKPQVKGPSSGWHLPIRTFITDSSIPS